jgi:hypothetical protein
MDVQDGQDSRQKSGRLARHAKGSVEMAFGLVAGPDRA